MNAAGIRQRKSLLRVIRLTTPVLMGVSLNKSILAVFAQTRKAMSNLKVSKKFVEDFNTIMKRSGASQGEIDLMKEDIRNEKFPFEHYEKWIEIEIGRMNMEGV